MRSVLKQIKQRKIDLQLHPLFTEWIDNPAVPLDEKFIFSPCAIDFIMGFRDLNKYFLYYPNPQNNLEEAINFHTREDETHSALFIEDWIRYGLNDSAHFRSWKPRDLLWFISDRDTRTCRKIDDELAEKISAHPNPVHRFAIIEALEEAGNVFFRKTVPWASKYEEQTGVELRYYGPFHLARETGHLQNADENQFKDAELTAEEIEHLTRLVNRVLDIFDVHFNEWLAFAKKITNRGTNTYHPRESAPRSFFVRNEEVVDLSAVTSPNDLCGYNLYLSLHFKSAVEAMRRGPFVAWLKQSSMDWIRALKVFAIGAIFDMWPCADFFEFNLTYENPSSALERGVNRLSLLSASEMNSRYIEWEKLNVDEDTRWSLSDTLQHFFFNETVDEYRCVAAEYKKLSFVYNKPLYRYWIAKSFSRLGDGVMNALKEKAPQGQTEFIAFAGQGSRLHPDLAIDFEADEAIKNIELDPVSEEDYENIKTIISACAFLELRKQIALTKFVEGNTWTKLLNVN